VSGTTNQIVTEIIIDADQAELSMAQLAAAQRAAQREFDKTTATIMQNTAATQRAAEAGIDVADSLTITAGALRKAKADSDAYLGRMDPLIFAHTSLSREMGKVGQAIKGVDTLLIAKKIKDEEAIARVKQLEMREKELIGVMAQLEAGTIEAADAMAFMSTTAERLSKGVKEVAVDVDGLRAKLVPLEAQQKAFAAAVAEIQFALDKEVISVNEAGDAYRRLSGGTSDAVKGMTDVEAHMYDVEAAARAMKLSVIAANQMTFDPRVKPGAAPVARQLDNTLVITDRLYGAAQEKRQQELEAVFLGLDKLTAKYDPLTAALQKYQNELADVISDHAKLGSSAAVIEKELAKVAAAYYANVKAINELGDAHVDFDALRASIDPLFAATQKYNKEIDRLLAAEKLLPTMSDAITAAIKRTTAAYDAEVVAIKKRDAAGGGTGGPTPEELNAMRAGFDKLFAAEEAYKAKLAEIAVWEKNVADGTAVANAARAEALNSYNKQVDAINGVSRAHVDHKKKVDDGTVSVGQMKFATQQLTVQTSQLISGIATGQPILMTLIQQGHQIIDVAISSGTGFSILGVVFKAIMSPIGLFITGMVTVVSSLALLISSSESAARRLTGLRNEISLVSDDYKNLASVATQAANDIAKNTPTSTADARAAAKAIVTTPGFVGGAREVEAIIDAFARLSSAQGKAELDMAQLGQALKDPVAFLAEMEKTLKGVDANLVDHARLLAMGGDKAAAFAVALKAVQDAGKPLERTLWQRAVEDLGKAFTATGQSGQQAFDGIGTAAGAMGAAIIKGTAMSVQALRDLNDWAQKTGGPALYGSWWPGGPAGGNLPAGMRPTTTYGGTADASLTAVARALLDVIAGPESGGRYNVRYGGSAGPQTFDSYASHPMVPVRIPGTNTTSDAAGRYQFLSSTYQPIASELGLTGFSPAEQDKAAWALAQSTYKRVTGRDLNADLLAGRTAGIPAALKEVWPSMPGGGQQGITLPEFTNALNARLRAMSGRDPEGGPTTVFSAAGMANQTKTIIDMANALSAGQPAKQAEALGKSLQVINNALVLDPKNEAYLQMRRDLNRQISEAIPEIDKLVNSIKESIDAESRQKDAWGQGNDAAIIQANANKARAEALRLVGKDSAELIPLQAKLAAAFNEQTRAAELSDAASAKATPQRRVEALNRELEATKELLKLDPNNVAWKQQQTELTRAIYETVPAFDAQVRKIKEEIDANSRMSLAWQHGSEAAQIQANREKALIAVREKFGPVTDERIAAEAQINKLYDEQLESTRKLEAEQAANTPARRAEELTTRLKYAQDAAKANPASAALAQQAAALTKELYDSVPAIDLQVRALKEDTAANDNLAESWRKGAEAAFHTEIANKALAEANKHYKEGSDDATKATAVLTLEMEKQAAAAAKVTLNKANIATKDEIALVQLQTKTLGMNADARELLIQKARDQIAVKNMAPGGEKEDKAERQSLLDDLARQNLALKNIEASVTAVSSAFTQAFDTIGNSITQALISGQGAAVNWKNVMVAAAQQVLQAFLKLAFVGPFLNYLGIGPRQPELFEGLNAIFAGGGAAGGRVTDDTSGRSTNGIGGSLSTYASGAGTLADLFGLKEGIGGSINSALGGPGGSLWATKGGGTIFTPITNYLGGPASNLFGSYGAAGSTVGGSLAGIGGGIAGGFVLGSLAGEGIQGARGTTGPAPEIGAGAGALMGTLAGFLITGGNPLGALIGGILGGTLGGGAGGFIGPKKASPYSSTLIDIADGHAVIGRTIGQGVDTDAERTQAIKDVDALNSYLDSVSLKLSSLGDVGQLGSNTPYGYQDPTKFKDLATGFDQLRFKSEDPKLNAYLQRTSFPDSATLQKAISDYHVLVENTIPTLMNFGKTTGTVEAAVKELNDAFNAAVEGSKKYGLATEDLTKAQAAGEAKIRDAANAQIRDFDTTLRIRRMQANGEDPRAIALASFDQGADQQRDAYKKQLVGMFGDAFTSTAYYADQMRQLEETLGAERVALVRQAAEQMRAAERQIRDIDEDLAVRLSNATPGDAQGKELFAFDVKANRETRQFGDQLVGIYGEAFRTTQAYADQINLMERVHGAERAEIVRKYAEAITAAWKSLTRADEDFNVRINAATKSTGPYDDLNKELYSFDVRARREREDFSDGMIASFGEAFRSTQAYADQMALEERTLGAERLAIIRKYNEQIEAAWKTVVAADEDLNARRVNAGSASAQDKELFSFDLSASRQRVAFRDQLIGLFGESFTASQSYADQMSLLEVTLGEERLAIVKKYADEITAKSEAAAATAAGSITSLVAYAQGLQTSNASPLSPQDQLSLARSRFNAVSGAAGAGDYTSIQQLQGYADTFLNASRAVYGSGEAYVSDFQRVLEALGAVANVAPDTLTASVLQVETRSQTAELVSSLADLKAAVETITTQLRQNSTAPARIAA
jgi:muramidase (phage lysozyme)